MRQSNEEEKNRLHWNRSAQQTRTRYSHSEKRLLVGQVSNMIVHFVRKAPNLAHW